MTTKNRTGSKHAAANALGSLDDRVRQLQSLVPGPDGGGSVAAPFTIGGYTFDEGGQVDLTKLADIARTGSRWEAGPFLPVISQGVTTDIAYTHRYSEVLIGDEVVWNFFFDFTGTGTAGSQLKVELPLPCHGADVIVKFVGQVQLYDASTTVRHSMEAETTDSGVHIWFAGSTTGNNLWGANPSIAIASTDQLRGMIRYRPRNAG
jgi:hypothetical protein